MQKKSMEFYDSFPNGYQKGKTKFFVVTGSVMSGVGKGTFTSALATLFQFYGLKTNMIKFDGYLNVDAGTLNPFRHGEVFVLDDGTETDLDLGTYERALNRNLSKDNYLTGGKIFNNIIKKERKGLYLGRDVQFIPHVTGEIKNFIRKLAMKSQPDILIIEVGGTMGDIENSYFIEAMREFKNEEGKNNVFFVNVTYIIEPPSLGEQKSKAAQLGIQKLMSVGVQPDLIICRSTNKVRENIKEKLSLISNLPVQNIISLENFPNLYEVPFYLEKEKLDGILLNMLKIKKRKKIDFYNKWKKMTYGFSNPKKSVEIAITGKYTGLHDSYISILNALEHVAAYLRCKVNIRWIETTNIKTNEDAEKTLKGVKGIIVPGGFGFRGSEGKIKCVEYVRKNNIPFLGLCLGFQIAVIEFARNVLNMKANSTEMDLNTKNPVIDLLPEQKKIDQMGATMRLGGHDIIIKEKSLAHKYYKRTFTRERFRHRYEVNPEYITKLEEGGLLFSGIAKEDKRIMQILELPENKFFFATQFHPEYTSRPLTPSPVFLNFIKASLL
ncbi:MAG: CTP synthase (glutamine hydrolyzing) [archaeon]